MLYLERSRALPQNPDGMRSGTRGWIQVPLDRLVLHRQEEQLRVV